MTDLYFAYGSNLDPEDWKRFCGQKGFDQSSLRPLKTAYLPDEVLVFDYRSMSRGGGALNIRPHRGGVVEGYLFEVSAEGWQALDRKEGHPKFYEREQVTVLDSNGDEIPNAVAYRAILERRTGFVPPSAEYLAVCRRGREFYELSTIELDHAVANEMRSACDAVFVYGTLMRGECRAPAWADTEVTCALLALAQGTLQDHGAFPAFVPATEDEFDGLVNGEFLRFGRIEDALERFDAIEGFAGFGRGGSPFRRTLVTVDVGGGRGRPAWAYVTSKQAFPEITSGDWRKHRGVRDAALTKILKEHCLTSNFLEQLANLPDGPFSSLYEEPPTFDRVLNDLTAERISERSLAQASGQWAVRWT